MAPNKLLIGVCHLVVEVKEIIIPLTISIGLGATAGTVYGESKQEARPGAILFQTWSGKGIHKEQSNLVKSKKRESL
jgi:hypothetical protein